MKWPRLEPFRKFAAMIEAHWDGIEAYGQVDLSMGYNWNGKLSFQFEAINLNDGIQRLHGRTKEQVVYVTQTGPRYMFGARYKF